jgi:inhibitor of nuclear factor kappa-B kinase subunit alpha
MSVTRIVKNQLHLRPYKIQYQHHLTEKMQATRLKRCKALLKRFADGSHKTILFSDEKLFSIEAHFNKQNDRILAPDMSTANKSGRLVSRSAHPASVMVWAGITATGKTPLVFVDLGVKVNQENYRNNILRVVVEPWAMEHFGNQPWTFQQDSAPAHRAKSVQEWCRTQLPDFITSTEWPPYSPDLNPLDFSVWAVLESKACAKRHTNVEALKASLVKAWEEIDEEYLQITVDTFPNRLKACNRARGAFFESD